MCMQGFSTSFEDKIGKYVYRLIDPTNNETFYFRKGMGNRIFSHANAIEKNVVKDRISLKFERIEDIRNGGLEILLSIQKTQVFEENDLPSLIH